MFDRTIASGRLLEVARNAANSCEDSADSCVIAVVFSAAAVEAWMNEMLHRLAEAAPHELTGPLDRLATRVKSENLHQERIQLRQRIKLFARGILGEDWSGGQQPYQDFSLLIDLRNSVLHQRPETTPIDVWQREDGSLYLDQPALANLGERLVQREVIERPPRSEVTSLIQLLQMPPVARWSRDTAQAVILDLAGALPSHWTEIGLLPFEQEWFE